MQASIKTKGNKDLDFLCTSEDLQRAQSRSIGLDGIVFEYETKNNEWWEKSSPRDHHLGHPEEELFQDDQEDGQEQQVSFVHQD